MVVELEQNAVRIIDENAAAPPVRSGKGFQRGGQFHPLANQSLSQRLDIGTGWGLWAIINAAM